MSRLVPSLFFQFSESHRLQATNPFTLKYKLTSLNKPSMTGLTSQKHSPVKLCLIIEMSLDFFFFEKRKTYLKIKWKIIATPFNLTWQVVTKMAKPNKPEHL